MAKAEASVEELVSMIERGELRLPEMQRRYVWRSTRVRDLLDSLYRGYPSGAILLWETVPSRAGLRTTFRRRTPPAGSRWSRSQQTRWGTSALSSRGSSWRFPADRKSGVE